MSDQPIKIDIIVVYIQRYKHGHEMDFVPPITGIHLAAITPDKYETRVIHQQNQQIDFDTDADIIALSFFSGFAPEAYRLAKIYKQKGKTVIAGGPHATFAAQEVLEYCDSVISGEVESIWSAVLQDFAAGCLQKQYTGQSIALKNIPTPRYDLLAKKFFIPKVVQATRGCPFSCSFCTVPTLNPGFRMRPIKEVIKDINYDDFSHWWQRKVVWFWDDNLTINRSYIKELLTEMIPGKRWWLTQASMDIARDGQLLDLMKKSGCIGIFFGIESFTEESLEDAGKRQNKIQEYKKHIKELHKRGICVMAGFIAGFDGDTPETITAMAKRLYDIGVDVPFLSILTPYKGTKLYKQLQNENRILEQGWEFYNGYNVCFAPKNMTPQELLLAHRNLWKETFSLQYALRRIMRSVFYLRCGAFLMATFMNVFYCLKKLRHNEPVCMENRVAWFRPDANESRH